MITWMTSTAFETQRREQWRVCWSADGNEVWVTGPPNMRPTQAYLDSIARSLEVDFGGTWGPIWDHEARVVAIRRVSPE